MTPDEHLTEAAHLLKTYKSWAIDKQQVMVNAAQAHIDLAAALRDQQEAARPSVPNRHVPTNEVVDYPGD